MYQYPYGDSQQLNLDWIINKLIKLEQSLVAGESAELEEFANALISLTYIPTQAYNNSDIVFHDGHLYRCNTTIPSPGEVWDPAHWDQIMLGNTVANLVRAVAGMNSDNVFNESNVSGTHVTEALNALMEDVRYDNHKIQQKKNGAYTDVIPVEDTPSNNSDRLASSKAAYDLKSALTSKISSTATILTDVNQLQNVSFNFQTDANSVVLNPNIDGAVIPAYATGCFITSGNNNGIIIASTTGSALFVFRRIASTWGVINLQLLTTAFAINEPTLTASQNITAGQLLFVIGYPYIATANIVPGTPLSTSTNLQALPNGALNYLKTLIDTLQTNLTTETSGGTDTAITTANPDFTISADSKYTIRGHIVEVNCILTANETTGSQAICTLPTPRIGTTIYPPPWQMFGDTPEIASSLLQNGTLYIRGTQSGVYGIHFTYFI